MDHLADNKLKITRIFKMDKENIIFDAVINSLDIHHNDNNNIFFIANNISKFNDYANHITLFIKHFGFYHFDINQHTTSISLGQYVFIHPMHKVFYNCMFSIEHIIGLSFLVDAVYDRNLFINDIAQFYALYDNFYVRNSFFCPVEINSIPNVDSSISAFISGQFDILHIYLSKILLVHHISDIVLSFLHPFNHHTKTYNQWVLCHQYVLQFFKFSHSFYTKYKIYDAIAILQRIQFCYNKKIKQKNNNVINTDVTKIKYACTICLAIFAYDVPLAYECLSSIELFVNSPKLIKSIQQFDDFLRTIKSFQKKVNK